MPLPRGSVKGASGRVDLLGNPKDEVFLDMQNAL
jgi:hypothetical protein